MKKYLCIGIVLMALSSCGGTESREASTPKDETVEAPDSFGYDMPIEALQSNTTTSYEGTGNISDGKSSKN